MQAQNSLTPICKEGKRKEKKKHISLLATPGLAESSGVLLRLEFRTIPLPTQILLLRLDMPQRGKRVGGEGCTLHHLNNLLHTQGKFYCCPQPSSFLSLIHFSPSYAASLSLDKPRKHPPQEQDFSRMSKSQCTVARPSGLDR